MPARIILKLNSRLLFLHRLAIIPIRGRSFFLKSKNDELKIEFIAWKVFAALREYNHRIPDA
jgi:hypothetical protein